MMIHPETVMRMRWETRFDTVDEIIYVSDSDDDDVVFEPSALTEK